MVVQLAFTVHLRQIKSFCMRFPARGVYGRCVFRDISGGFDMLWSMLLPRLG